MKFEKVYNYICKEYNISIHFLDGKGMDIGYVDFGVSEPIKPYRFSFNLKENNYYLFVFDIFDKQKVILQFCTLEHIYKFLTNY